MEFRPGGKFKCSNCPLDYLIEKIYDIRPFQLVGDSELMAIVAGPKGVRYEIEAIGEPSASIPEIREMVKNLLADRFKFRSHKELRSLSVYALRRLKKGTTLARTNGPTSPEVGGGVSYMANGWIEGKNVSMGMLAHTLSTLVDRPVIDMTETQGSFDFRLTFRPEASEQGSEKLDEECPSIFEAVKQRKGLKSPPVTCPSIYTALTEELGLKLDPLKAPIEVLVVDHIETPSSN